MEKAVFGQNIKVAIITTAGTHLCHHCYYHRYITTVIYRCHLLLFLIAVIIIIIIAIFAALMFQVHVLGSSPRAFRTSP
jgi:hypothetical protein